MPRRSLPTHSGSRWEPVPASAGVPAAGSTLTLFPPSAPSASGAPESGPLTRGATRRPWVLGAGAVMAAVAALVSAWLWVSAPATTLAPQGGTGISGSGLVPGQDGGRHGSGTGDGSGAGRHRDGFGR